MSAAGRNEACVVIAFKDRKAELRDCLGRLCPQVTESRHLLLVDDGSRDDIACDPAFAGFLAHSGVHLVRQPVNLGVSRTRNTGINWCRERGYEIVVMTDSDCLAPDDFIAAHVALHRKHPEAAVAGGCIIGVGATLWARLDGMMSWFHCIPGSPEMVLEAPYTAPTANISIKIGMLPFGDRYFDERLRTGEDSAFARRVRRAGFSIVRSPHPEIAHKDREAFGAFIRHQYEFGRHHYVIAHQDLGLAGLCFRPWYRLAFAPAFALALPLYAALGCWLNMRPWLARDPRRAVYWPLLQVVWLLKGVAVLESAVFPDRAFRLENTADRKTPSLTA